MKKSIKIFVMFFVLLIINGCSKTVERTDRTLTMIQDQVTSIISTISEIEFNESQIQPKFEEMIHSAEELKAFQSNNAPIYENIRERGKLIEELKKNNSKLTEFKKEIESQRDNKTLPNDEVTKLIDNMGNLIDSLNIYTTDYTSNLGIEERLYQALANPETDYHQFFQIFNKTGTITTNNQMNLEKLIGYFEPINSQLINLKVIIADTKDGKE